jgi:hypothetical protein
MARNDVATATNLLLESQVQWDLAIGL